MTVAPVADPRDILRRSFDAAVAAADPLEIVPRHLPAPPKGRTLVIGAGKAAASMALAVESHWPASAPLDGLVITRYQHGLLTNRIKVIEAGHPVPDEAGETAAREIAKRVRALGRDDLLLALVSGGGSSLLSLPVEGIPMADLKATTKALLLSGAPIEAMNTVRKHLSAIQGGRLAAMCKAPVVALVISDVTGDDPTHIASGPTAPDPTTYADALDLLAAYGVTAPASVSAHLQRGARGEIPETPKPGDRALAHATNLVIATAQQSLAAGAAVLRSAGIAAAVLGDSVTGEACEVAKVYAALARQVRLHDEPFRAPVALIALGIALEGQRDTWALAADTDGIDGSEDNAGAILTPDSFARAHSLGLDARKLLAGNDAYGFFAPLGDLVTTGPTRTNVNDYRAILVL